MRGLPVPVDPDDAGGPAAIPADRAVVDRIVDASTAVLLVGPDEFEVHIPAEALPDGAADGTWLVIDLDGPSPRIVEIDQARTDELASDLADRLAHLRATRSRGRFQRDVSTDPPPDEPGHGPDSTS